MDEYKRSTQGNWSFPDLEIEDLGELKPCMNCGRSTYAWNNLPEDAGCRRLPEGFTQNNRRMVIFCKEKYVLLCTQCRYESEYRRY